jgi:hypothetical protein
MLPNTTSIILFTSSLEIMLGMTIVWLQKLNHTFSNIASIALTISGVIIAYYTILHLRERWIGQKLDNKLKRKELEK